MCMYGKLVFTCTRVISIRFAKKQEKCVDTNVYLETRKPIRCRAIVEPSLYTNLTTTRTLINDFYRFNQTSTGSLFINGHPRNNLPSFATYVDIYRTHCDKAGSHTLLDS